MRRSRRNGQLRRVSSWSLGSQGAMRISSVSRPALAMIAAERVGEERAAPELQAAAGGAFVADAVDGRDVDAVGDRVRPLDGLPGSTGPRRTRPSRRDASRSPSDRTGSPPLEGRQPGGLGIPLVPADERADPGERRVERLEPEVAGGEVVLLVIERVVGDVHLAIDGRASEPSASRTTAVLW